jgi:hypothetical protein
MGGQENGTHRKLFGEVAVEQGFVQPEELKDALKLQLKESMEHGGNRRPLGMIMAQMGLITRLHIQEILSKQT